MSAMKSASSLRALVLTPERIPTFIIPSIRSPFLASPMFRRLSTDRSALLSEDDDEEPTGATLPVTPSQPAPSSRCRFRLRSPRCCRPRRAADDAVDADPTTRAAMSLPHVPKVTTPYGFSDVLATTPSTSRRESLFHRNRPVKVTVNDADPPGASPAADGPQSPGGSRVSYGPVKALGLQIMKELKRPAAALMALSPSARGALHR